MVIRWKSILVGLTTYPFAAFAADGGMELGKNLLGQDCHAVSIPASSASDHSLPAMEVFCGESKEPVGTIQTTIMTSPIEGGTSEVTHAAIQSALTDNPVMASMNVKLVCQPGQWMQGANGEVLASSCTYREGGWQAITIAALRGTTLTFASGPPSLLPVLNTFISGGTRSEDAPSDTQQLESLLGGKASLYDANEVNSYRDLVKLGRLQDSIGKYADAEQAYRKALDIQQRSGGGNDAAQGDTVMNLAIEVSNQGRFDEAHELFKVAEPMVQKSLDSIDDSRFVSYLAVDAANRQSYAEALNLARRATAARRILVDGETPLGSEQSTQALANASIARAEIVQSRLLEASMLLRLGDYGNALEAVTEALEISQSALSVPAWWRAEAMVLAGEIEGKLGHSTKAEPLVKDGIALFHRLFADARPTALATLSLGKVYADGGDYPKAMDAFRQGFTMLQNGLGKADKISFDAVSDYFRTALELADHDEVGRNAILAELFSVLQDVQRGKESEIVGRSVLRMGQNDPRFAALLRDLQDAEKARNDMRLSLANEAAKSPDARDPDREHWLAEQYHANADKAVATETILQRFPEYSRITQNQTITLADLQTQLHRGETFVTFAFGEEFGMVFAITHDTVTAKLINQSARNLGESIRGLREGILVRNGRVGTYDVALAHKLYQQLMGPVASTLVGTKHLIVASSGAVASLPMAALVTAEPKGNIIAWAIRQMAISEVPSATAFMTLRKNVIASNANRPFIGIGNPHFTGTETGGGFTAIANGCRGDGPMPPELLMALPPLPDTAAEVQNVAKALGGKGDDILLGDQATEQGLRHHPLDQYRVLYFATHGLLPAELRCQSEPALALSPPMSPAQSKAEDGLFEADEIAGLRLDADLVVLSACNTATSTGRFGGETLSSLADVFFYAGSRAVLATHWSVPSASTTKLMTRMFETYAKAPDAGYAMALQQAQLEILSNPQTSHPLHWAGFTLMGGTIATKSPAIAGVVP